MNFQNMFEMQFMLFALMVIGAVIRSRGMVTDEGKKLLTDLVVNITLPCSIVKSFQMEFSGELLKSCLAIFLVAIAVQVGCWLLGFVLYPKANPRHKKVLQYSTICSNAGILGNPIAEGIFGSIGLLYASVYLIPQRTFMWSAGLTYFTQCPDKKSLVKKVVTHPCIIAVLIGLVLLVTQVQLPGAVSRTVNTIAGANTAVSMMLIGTILAGVPLRELVEKTTCYLAFVRLVLIPVLIWGCCLALGLEPMVTNVAVVLGAMPVASTTVILAAKYDSDAEFASKCVVFTTLLSMITIPIWCVLLVMMN